MLYFSHSLKQGKELHWELSPKKTYSQTLLQTTEPESPGAGLGIVFSPAPSHPPQPPHTPLGENLCSSYFVDLEFGELRD